MGGVGSGDLDGESFELVGNGGEISLVDLVLGVESTKFFEKGVKMGLEMGLLGFKTIKTVLGRSACVAGHGGIGMKAPINKGTSRNKR